MSKYYDLGYRLGAQQVLEDGAIKTRLTPQLVEALDTYFNPPNQQPQQPKKKQAPAADKSALRIGGKWWQTTTFHRHNLNLPPGIQVLTSLQVQKHDRFRVVLHLSLVGTPLVTSPLVV